MRTKTYNNFDAMSNDFTMYFSAISGLIGQILTKLLIVLFKSIIDFDIYDVEMNSDDDETKVDILLLKKEFYNSDLIMDELVDVISKSIKLKIGNREIYYNFSYKFKGDDIAGNMISFYVI